MHSDKSKVDVAQLRSQCTRQLSRHPRMGTRAWLAWLAASAYADLGLDEYGQGELVQQLESRVAALLGKPQALFMPKGTIAQQIALRVHAEQSGNRRVAIHPQSHMALDECDAVSELADLEVVKIGETDRALRLIDLNDAAATVGTLTIELPLRRAGFRLPPWDELVAITQWAKERHILVHFDGARLWECTPYYGKSLAEIANLADSVYVSLYKGLGAMAGCLLLGTPHLLAASQQWQHRYGGFLYTAAPYLVGGLQGLDQHLQQMDRYVATAHALCAELSSGSNIRVTPNPPQTNGFQVRFDLPADVIWERCLTRAANAGVWLFDGIAAVGNGAGMGEIQVGEATLSESASFWCNEIAELARV